MRHNEPFEILEYGEGKCREFSVLFTAICLANGYRARLILDMSDHAWTEVWNEKRRKWIHVDPSERRIDDPGMYEREWKKKLMEVYSFEGGKLEEVTENHKLCNVET
ncbi:MAG: transglutaminase-like domain-containing protein [Candidatus Bathyarchaeota archaeon]|nr:transglutaminase-like domain-containing protein [Candidatus Bathyarchaeota archaeon]